MLGFQFHRQVPMLDYIVDFYCHELQLAIEIDGNSHNFEDIELNDQKRQKRLEEEGVIFLRFDDIEVKQNRGAVTDEIIKSIENNINASEEDTPPNGEIKNEEVTNKNIPLCPPSKGD